MVFRVHVRMRSWHPLTEKVLFDVANLAGAASGTPGGFSLDTTLAVDAEDVPHAVARAIELVTERVAGSITAVEVMVTDPKPS